MVYINTTGKHNEVWLDKPYATITVECPDCPSTEDAYNSGWTDGSEDGYHKGYQSGYTDGLGACSAETCEGIWEDGYLSGVTNQKNKLASTAITQNGTYTRVDGWSSVTINVSGYSQADLDAAYASGYSAGLNDCSGYTPVSGDSVLDLVYETTEPNQTIDLFHGDAPNNGWFALFFSALTAIEIDGVTETPDASNIQVRNSVSSYTHTFATAGKHQVKLTVSDDYTDALGHNPARMLKQLLFSLELDGNLNNLCPLVEANIGEGYEVIYFGAFTDQHGLTGLTLPDTLTTLSGYPFEATGLIDVTIPENVTEIGHKSFYNCSAITAMTFEGLTPPTLSGTEPLGSTAYTFPIYVPTSAVSAYQNEPSWADYASRVQAKP